MLSKMLLKTQANINIFSSLTILGENLIFPLEKNENTNILEAKCKEKSPLNLSEFLSKVLEEFDELKYNTAS